ncbi:hypothetical protein Tco_1112320 [Tanacetum coccineum]|uniref:Uncharacterized protein n=1 Tax=Tanacetum coccineum TaxID=301880 RepID=A0ABQ5IRC0_9ASTR
MPVPIHAHQCLTEQTLNLGTNTFGCALQLGPERARVFTGPFCLKEKEGIKLTLLLRILTSRKNFNDNLIDGKPNKYTCPPSELSNARNKRTVEEDRVVVQDVCDRYNVNNQVRHFRGTNARGNVVAGNVGGQNRVEGNMIPGEQVTNFDDVCGMILALMWTMSLMMINAMAFDSDDTRDMAEITRKKNDGDNASLKSCEPYNANDVTDLLEQNDRFRAEIEKVKQHYKNQLEGNLKVATRSSVKPKVLANLAWRGVEVVREIVEEARVVLNMDNALNYACQYTKHLGIATKDIHTSGKRNLVINGDPQKEICLRELCPLLRLSDSMLVSTKQSDTSERIMKRNSSTKLCLKYYEGVGLLSSISLFRGTPSTKRRFVESEIVTLWKQHVHADIIISTMFLWAAAVATACYTQNRSLIHTRHNKTPYELVFLRVFGALCYPTNDSEDLGKFQAKADIGDFRLDASDMAPLAFVQDPMPIMMTPGQLNSGLAPSHVPATTNIPPTDKDLEILFQPMFDEYFEQSTDSEPVPTAYCCTTPFVSSNTYVDTPIAQDCTFYKSFTSSLQVHPPVFPHRC